MLQAIANFFRRPASAPAPKTSLRSITWDQAFNAGLIHHPTRSGQHVDERAALSLSVLYRGARVISEAVGGMPCKLYQRDADGQRSEAREHPLFGLLHRDANPESSFSDFLTQAMFWAVLYGSAYAELVRDGAGRVVEMWAVHPAAVTVEREAGRLVYRVDTGDGPKVTLQASDMLHIKGPSIDGSCGSRLAEVARESLGFSLAADRYGASFFGNAARPSGLLTSPGTIGDDEFATLKQQWDSAYTGDKAGKVAILENGLQWQQITTTNEAGQYDETRQFQVYELCRWIGIDPVFVYDYGRATWANAEAQTRNFLSFTLNPYLKRWEGEIERKALLPGERDTYYAEFTRESVVQMDATTQSNLWAVGIQNGWYTPDEVRKWLNLPPLPEPDPAPPPPDQAAAQDKAQPDDTQAEDTPDDA